ncbi:ImmA/IrrE family metallo-endopeptidase [Pseudarthrobacter sp. S9]|uniref:ImmA/IrrE family metallo-endopeptidase n=1 Tax=Pseudarthrobacter sp. S9 TaxID=3418421 RepID=UPI003D070BE2
MTTLPKVTYRHLPGDRVGEYDLGKNLIILDPRTSKTTQRCTLVHEMIHWERGDVATGHGWFDARIEHHVEMETARRLISVEELAAAMEWADHPQEVAELLDVDLSVLVRRFGILTFDEAQYLARRVGPMKDWPVLRNGDW